MSRKVKFQYHLLRNGAFCAYMRADKSRTPTIRMNDADGIKTSLSARFAPEAVDTDGNAVEIDWISDEIQVVMIINGQEHSLGVFLPAKVKEVTRGKAKRLDVQAFDRCWRVRDTKSGTLLYWPSGTAYLTAIKQLLAAAGVEVIFATPTEAAFTEDREDWKLGESYLTVVNALLSEINYKPLYFDSNGCAVLEPVSLPESGEIKHIFDGADPETMVIPSLEREADYYEAPNVFIVYCANPDKSGNMTATARNDNPQSPLSVSRRGREIVKVEQVDNIASQAELQGYADWLRDKSMISGETVTVETGLRPGFGVAEAVGIIYGDLTDIGVEHAYSMTLKVGGTMRHTVERVVYDIE